MGFSQSAYHFYGAYVPETQWQCNWASAEGERLDDIIRELFPHGDAASVRVGHLAAGDYDRNMLFLCISIEGLDIEVELGEFRMSPDIPDLVNWGTAIRMVADAAGYQGLVTGWITVPDLS